MRAVFLDGPRTLAERETGRPTLAADEVLLQVRSTGICGSDLEYYANNRCGAFVVRGPLVLGHEFSGKVVELGSNVHSVAVGTRVAVDPSIPCRLCSYCRGGRHNLCENLGFVGTAAVYPPISGGLGEYVAIPAVNCHVIPNAVTWEQATCLEPLSVAVHAALRPDRIAGMRVLISGGGAIGQLIALVCRAMGAAAVVVSEIQEFRRNFALQQGVDLALDPSDAEDLNRARESFGGFDVVFEASGAPPAIRLNLDLAAKGGSIVQVGTVARDVELPVNVIMAKELSFLGSLRYGEVFPMAMNLLSRKLVNVEPLVSAVFPFEQTPQAFELAAERGNTIKVQIEVADF